MTQLEFTGLVRHMRAKQREYFRSRTPQLLNECRDLERKADKALDELANPATPGLFDREAAK